MIMHAVRFRWSYPRHSSITCVTSNLQSCRNCQVMIVVPSRQCCGCDSSKPRVVCEDLGNPAFLKMSSLLPPDEWFEATGSSLDSPSLSPSEPLQCDRSPLKGKRYRHGSLADLVSRRSLPPGPRDLGELLNYPQSVVQVLFSDANRAHRCLTLLSQGLTDHSDYSGLRPSVKLSDFYFRFWLSSTLSVWTVSTRSRVTLIHVASKSCAICLLVWTTMLLVSFLTFEIRFLRKAGLSARSWSQIPETLGCLVRK